MQHLEDGLLHELVDGEVPSEDLAPIQQHLKECAACRARLASARDLASFALDLIEGLDATEHQQESATPILPMPGRRTRSEWRRGIGLAASLTVAVGLGWAARDLVPPPGAEGPSAPSVTSLPAVAAPADAVAASETPARDAAPVLSSAPPPAPSVAEHVPRGASEAFAEPTERDRALAGRTAGAGARIEHRAEVASPAAPQATGAPTPSLRATNEGQRTLAEEGPVTSDVRRQLPTVANANALVPRDSDQSTAKMTAIPVVIEFAEAIAILGGRLRLVDGLVPSRLERVGEEVRVIYPNSTGNLVLSQQRVGDDVRWRLTAPASFPADSLEALRRRVDR